MSCFSVKSKSRWRQKQYLHYLCNGCWNSVSVLCPEYYCLILTSLLGQYAVSHCHCKITEETISFAVCYTSSITHPPTMYLSSTVFLTDHQWYIILTEECKEVAPDLLSLHIHELYTLISRKSMVLIKKKKACSYHKMSLCFNLTFQMLVYIMDRQVQYYMSWGNNKLILLVYNGIILSYCSSTFLWILPY